MALSTILLSLFLCRILPMAITKLINSALSSKDLKMAERILKLENLFVVCVFSVHDI